LAKVIEIFLVKVLILISSLTTLTTTLAFLGIIWPHSSSVERSILVSIFIRELVWIKVTNIIVLVLPSSASTAALSSRRETPGLA
jgi:hypothetical protein